MKRKKYELQQVRLSTAELAEFGSKTELYWTYIWHRFIHSDNRGI